MARKYMVPGSDHIDNMRRLLTKLEMAFSEPGEAADQMEVSVWLTSLENERTYMEAAICNEFSISAGAEIDISQL